MATESLPLLDCHQVVGSLSKANSKGYRQGMGGAPMQVEFVVTLKRLVATKLSSVNSVAEAPQIKVKRSTETFLSSAITDA